MVQVFPFQLVRSKLNSAYIACSLSNHISNYYVGHEEKNKTKHAEGRQYSGRPITITDKYIIIMLHVIM